MALRDLLLQPRSLGIARRRTRVRQSLLLCSDIGQEPLGTARKSPDRMEYYPLGYPSNVFR